MLLVVLDVLRSLSAGAAPSSLGTLGPVGLYLAAFAGGASVMAGAVLWVEHTAERKARREVRLHELRCAMHEVRPGAREVDE